MTLDIVNGTGLRDGDLPRRGMKLRPALVVGGGARDWRLRA